MKKLMQHIDKIKHFLVSAGLIIGLSFFMPIILSVITTLLVGIAKELSDSKIDVYALIADVVGIITGVLVEQLQ